MTLKDNIVEAMEVVEASYGAVWRTGKGSKANLIEAFSQTDSSPSEYLGYKTNDGLSHAMSRAIPTANKLPGMPWRNWLLLQINKFLCTNCNTVHDLSNRYTASRNLCKDCDRDKSSRRLSAGQKIVLQALKNSGGCKDCGETDIVVLEFDHLRDKEFDIGNGKLRGTQKLLEEINKCDIVCANCHRRRTAKRAGNWYKSNESPKI